MKIIALIRVSTEQQDLDQQRLSVINECHHLGYDDKDIIVVEDKESGIKLDEAERLGIQKLKRYVESDSDINCVICFEISRLSRRGNVVYSVRDYLIERHINLVVLNPYFKMLKEDGTLSETSNIFFGIFSAMAENEMMIKKQRFARGRAHKKALGQWVAGNHLFGYKSDKSHHIIINEEEVAIIKRIYNMYLNEGLSTHQIAKELLMSGHFEDMSQNTAMVKVCRTLNCKDYLGTDIYPQIINKDMYDAAQAKLSTKRTHTKDKMKSNDEFWCKGLVTDTSLNYTVHSALDRYQTKKGSCIARKQLHKVVEAEMIKYYKANQPDVNSMIKDTMNKIQLITRKIAKTFDDEKTIILKKDKVWERNIEGRISDDKAKAMSDKFDRELSELYNNRRIFEREKESLSIDEYYNEDGTLVDMSIDFTKMSDKEKFEAVHSIFDKIIIEKVKNTHKKNIIFVYKK